MEAARRGVRRVLRARFYAEAEIVSADQGYVVQLDGVPVRTPARRLLAMPTRPLAQAVADEWQAQHATIDPQKMPLTRLANSIIDGVAKQSHAVAEEVGKYLAYDLLFYRAASPQGLRDRQQRHWDPILTWAAQALGARFNMAEGIVHVGQPESALQAVGAAIPKDPWQLGAVHAATTLTGSALIALALALDFLSTDDAWQAANVDEDWNMEQWGRDELALERRAFRFAELQAAATVLHNVR